MYYFFFFIFLCSSAIGMQRVVMDDETAPLLAQRSICMKKQPKSPTTLYDVTHGYYDGESEKKVRNEAIKRCLCDTAVASIGMGCFAGISSLIVPTTCLYACGTTKGCCIFTQIQGGIFLDVGTLSSATGLGLSIPFYGLGLTGDILSDPLKTVPAISSDIYEAARPNKIFWVAKESLKHALSRTDTRSAKTISEYLYKLGSGFYNSEKKVLMAIRRRLERKCIIREIFAHELRQKHGMEKNLIKYLLSFLNFSKTNTLTYISEKELLHILNGLYGYQINEKYPPILATYNRFLSLVQRGWLSFTQNGKYPIKCEPEYFDANALPKDQLQFYADPEGPTLFLPYSPTLAQYYKFEDDPAYLGEWQKPTSEKMQTLLQERERIIAQKTGNHRAILSINNSNN